MKLEIVRVVLKKGNYPTLITSGSWENLKEDWEDFESINISLGPGSYDARQSACRCNAGN